MMTSSLRVLSLFLLALVAAGCSSPVEREARALKKGDEYFAAQNFDKARVEYRNALQQVPNDGEARFRNGLVLEKLGQPRDAAQFYIGALEVKPDLIEARTRLARLYVVGGVPERALDVVKPGLEKMPNDAGLLSSRAAARARLHDLDGAMKDAEAAAAQNPKDESVVAILAGLYTASGQQERSAVLLGTAIRENPGTVDLRLALAQIELALGHPERAEALLRDVIRLKPTEAAYRIGLARLLANGGKADAAQQMLAEARGALPANVDLRTAMVEFLIANRGRAAAEAELRRASESGSDRVDSQFMLAGFYAQGKELPKAETLLREIIAGAGSGPAGLTARTRLAAMRMIDGDVATAEKLVEEVLDKSPRDTDALALRGNMRLAKGDAKGAIEDLRAASRDQPNSSGILAALSRAHEQNHEPALAEEVLRRAVDANPADTQVRMQLVGLLERSGRGPEARAGLYSLAKEQPGDLTIQAAAFRAALGVHDLAGARGIVDRLRASDAGRPRAAWYAGMIAEDAGHVDEAIKAYRDAVEADPALNDALLRAVKLLVSHQRQPEALRLLDAVAAKLPADPTALVVKGDTLVAAKNYAAAEEAYRAAIARAPRSWAGYPGLAYVAIGRGDVPGALRLLQEAAPNVDEPWRLHAQAAQVLEGAGRPDDAMASYEKALASGGDGSVIVNNNLAMLLVTNRDDAASHKRAAVLVGKLGAASAPQLLDTIGWVRFKNGDLPGALTVLEAASKAAKLPVVLYHLGVVQDASGQHEQALASLRAAVESHEKFQGVDEATAMIAHISAKR
jgi:tetratricopeptide (TPR) repeat protein